MNKNKILLPKWIVVLLTVIILIQGFLLLTTYSFNSARNNPVEIQNRSKQENLGFLKVIPSNIRTNESVEFEYGYKDSSNNEHLKSAKTVVTVETPDHKLFTSYNAKSYPSDFPGASTSAAGTYHVWVVRSINTSEGLIDVLFNASSLFEVKPIDG